MLAKTYSVLPTSKCTKVERERARETGTHRATEPKSKLAAGGDITEVTLALGDGALGMTQVSEIAGKLGAEFAGPLPEELQNYTVFVAGIPIGATQPEAVASFVKVLKSPTANAVLEAKGMQTD